MDLTERIKTAIKQRNNFSLTYDSVLTADFGDFVPIVCQEMVPTDKFEVNAQVFCRMAPLAVPTYGKIHGYVNSFYVPNRILMPENEFNDSITGGPNGDYPETFPFITYGALVAVYKRIQTLYDDTQVKRFRKFFSYLGLGNIIEELSKADAFAGDAIYNSTDASISMLPMLAFFRVYYDYYCPVEDDLQAVTVRETYTHKYSGLITSYNTADIERLALAFGEMSTCYNKDYFTTAFTKPQRGAASLAPVDIAGTDLNPNLRRATNATTGIVKVNSNGGVGTSTYNANVAGTNSVVGQVSAHVLNYATKVQQFLERNNIAGAKSFEQMLARFGVRLSNEKLQRSNYLGGNDFYIQVSDVTSTSDNRTSSTDTTAWTSLGGQAGKGIGLGKKNVSYSADEYGFFITIFHFVPETNGLVDGLGRMWTRHDKFDYWQPELEDTGMQPIYMKELNRHLDYYLGDDGSNDNLPNAVFGYVPRYAEYKFANPVLAGDFAFAQGIYGQNIMDAYNLYRRIGTDDPENGDNSGQCEAPSLNPDFMKILGFDAGHNNFNRIFQATNATFDHFFINAQVAIGANRPMIGYAEGGLEFTEDEDGNARVSLPYGGMRL